MESVLKSQDFQAWAASVSLTYAEQRFMSGNGTKCLAMEVFMNGRIDVIFDEKNLYSGNDFESASQAYSAVRQQFDRAFPPDPLHTNPFFPTVPAADAN